MLLQTLALSPVLIPQALWTAARAARLPEAAGPRQGEVGEGPDLRLLVLGDSSAAGVGVGTQSEALGGQLAAQLGRRARVRWEVKAASGATVRSTRRMLATAPPAEFDVATIALGVNDTKNGVSQRAWHSGYEALLDLIEERFGAPRVCVTGLPPLGDFPLLPWPLNAVLGERAARFDACLREIAAARGNVVHIPMHLPLDVSSLASDGFHPGPEVYRAWAGRVVEAFDGWK